jgi:sporulation protein YabP
METVKKAVETQSPHQLTLADRKLLGVEGVSNMDSYDQEKIVFQTSVGVLEVKGNKLHVRQLNLEQGKAMLDGEIDSLAYLKENGHKSGKSFLSKLTK